MKVLAITQARIGSTRLPEKILKTINGISLLEIHLKRISRSNKISKLIVATTTEPDAIKIINIASKLGIEVYQGSTDNVLERFYLAALKYNPEYIVRLTSDCPLIDSNLIDQIIQFTFDTNQDYVSNTLLPTFPDGVDIEVFKFQALKKAMREAILKSDKEHVTPYIWRNSTAKGGNLFAAMNFSNHIDYSDFRITVDQIEDFQVIDRLVTALGDDVSWNEYIEYLITNPQIKNLNSNQKRNEGYKKSLLND